MMNSPALVAGPVLLGLLLTAAAPAGAQERYEYRGVPGIQQNNTGGRPSRIISRGPLGADTITDNSAAGGNAGRPELAFPNGSAGGGGGGGNR